MNRLTLCSVATALLVTLPSGASDDEAEPDSTEKKPPVRAGQSLELQTTSITGDNELPKVLVIVPWKSPELVEMTGRPLSSLVEDALRPIDPEVFRRRLEYFKALSKDEEQTSAKN